MANAIAQAWKRFQSAAVTASHFVQDVASEVQYETADALRTGFGVPRAASSVASLTCFAVAAAGTSAVAFDFVGKFFGVRECSGCCGWETVTCQACDGRGEAMSSDSGSEQCSTCIGTGVTACPVCHGDSWRPKFTADRILDSPFQAWDIYRHTTPVYPDSRAMQDPRLAAAWLFALPEIESGQAMDDETKKAIWLDYLWAHRFDSSAALLLPSSNGQDDISTDIPNVMNDPLTLSLPVPPSTSARATSYGTASSAIDLSAFPEDSFAARHPELAASFFPRAPRGDAGLAEKETEIRKQVQAMAVPPRPKDFATVEPKWVSEPDWSQVQSEAERQEWKELLRRQEVAEEAALNTAWQQYWREMEINKRVKAHKAQLESATAAGATATSAGGSSGAEGASTGGKKAAGSGKVDKSGGKDGAKGKSAGKGKKKAA